MPDKKKTKKKDSTKLTLELIDCLPAFNAATTMSMFTSLEPCRADFASTYLNGGDMGRNGINGYSVHNLWIACNNTVPSVISFSDNIDFSVHDLIQCLLDRDVKISLMSAALMGSSNWPSRLLLRAVFVDPDNDARIYKFYLSLESLNWMPVDKKKFATNEALKRSLDSFSFVPDANGTKLQREFSQLVDVELDDDYDDYLDSLAETPSAQLDSEEYLKMPRLLSALGDSVALCSSDDLRVVSRLLSNVWEEISWQSAPPGKAVPEINMICLNTLTKQFYLSSLKMVGWPEPEDTDLCLHYGAGMDKFHHTLVKKLETSKKGITLFHGDAGTGKTFYIRRLCHELARMNKTVVLVPGALVADLASPAFANFMLSSFTDSDAGVILLLEDAEVLLIKREEGSRTEAGGISTLLNLTDGILNDAFNIQVIATFNTQIENLDAAILRKGRLIANKHFGPLSVNDARALAETLGLDPQLIQRDTTIAEIYALISKDEDQILLHSSEQ